MEHAADTKRRVHPPIYWVLFVTALLLFVASWVGERQGWSSSLTAVLTLVGVALLVVDSLVFRHGPDR